MLSNISHGVILEKTDREFENQAVLNPSAIVINGATRLYYRAVKKGNYSSVGLATLNDHHAVLQRWDRPILASEFAYETHGTEDPRIVFFEGQYDLFYTAYDGTNALIAYATSLDGLTFIKHGVISPRLTYDAAEDLFRRSPLRERYSLFESYYKDRVNPGVLLWEKDSFIFPKRIKGRIGFVHRVLPGIQLLWVDDVAQLSDNTCWQAHLKDLGNHIILDPVYWYESRNVGGGCPPIETDDGWLLIYHAVEDRIGSKIYHASAALVDGENPLRVIGRLPEPLFSPTEPWEKNGDVNNVVFPTGAVVKGDALTIYYGAADSCIAARTFSLSELLKELKRNPPPR